MKKVLYILIPLLIISLGLNGYLIYKNINKEEKGEDNFAILNGYDNKTNEFILRGIDKNANINVGDEVLTSGLGGVFPTGIYIGKVLYSTMV